MCKDPAEQLSLVVTGVSGKSQRDYLKGSVCIKEAKELCNISEDQNYRNHTKLYKKVIVAQL